MYVGITHETAPVEERAYYALSETQKEVLIVQLKSALSIQAITILTTCNRTEIYFESDQASTIEVRNMLIAYVQAIHEVSLNRTSFLLLDRSIDTINHLLYVANGLRSAVIGDKQIITQVKQAYQQSLREKNQGSLLERAFQAVFRSHKRISNESLYQRGSTSTAYSSLKIAESYFGKKETEDCSLLIIGAGEIAEDLLQYLPKFRFRETFIANRTAEKADRLAQRYGVRTYDWKSVEDNHFGLFDVIITAVSHRQHLIKNVGNSVGRRLWVDLSMPSNVDPSIEDYFNKVYNIDEVTELVDANNQAQITGIPKVEEILKEELTTFINWLKKDKVRAFLRSYKHHAKQTFLQTVPPSLEKQMDKRELNMYAEQLANHLTRKSAKSLNHLNNSDINYQHLSIIQNAFGV